MSSQERLAEIEHGTYRGYQKHVRLRREGHTNDEPCQECRAASAAYLRSLRASNPGVVARAVRGERARARALSRLAELHPDEFAVLYREERNALAESGAE